MRYLSLLVAFIATPALAVDPQGADIVFLGEVHDNPAHHARQATMVAQLSPKAVVWEMLSAAKAALVSPDGIGDEAGLGSALGWADSGWPEFSMYYPIFAAAPQAAHRGALLPREEARRVMGEPVGTVFGDAAARFGLDAALSSDQQIAREAMQLAAHCDALPPEMLPMMVDIQRLRDARLAQVALQAFEDTGGPVAVITGNGHARSDWGAPALLAQAAPDLKIWTLGQAEAGRGAPDGGFDAIEETEAVERDDPCEAFQKG